MTDENDLMIIKKSGVTIRLVLKICVMGRATQGVRLITLKDNEHIAAVTKVNKDEDEPEENIEINSESSTNYDLNKPRNIDMKKSIILILFVMLSSSIFAQKQN